MLAAWRFVSLPRPEPSSRQQRGQENRPENPETAFEASDWPLWPVALVYVLTLALVLICCFVIMVAFPNALPDVGRVLRISPPGARLQTDPVADMQRFRAEEDKRLNSYYWINREGGVVHIPIEEAMKKLTRTGIPGFPKAQQ